MYLQPSHHKTLRRLVVQSIANVFCLKSESEPWGKQFLRTPWTKHKGISTRVSKWLPYRAQHQQVLVNTIIRITILSCKLFFHVSIFPQYNFANNYFNATKNMLGSLKTFSRQKIPIFLYSYISLPI
jgi:hypothetical protein